MSMRCLSCSKKKLCFYFQHKTKTIFFYMKKELRWLINNWELISKSSSFIHNSPLFSLLPCEYPLEPNINKYSFFLIHTHTYKETMIRHKIGAICTNITWQYLILIYSLLARCFNKDTYVTHSTTRYMVWFWKIHVCTRKYIFQMVQLKNLSLSWGLIVRKF